MSEDRKVPSEGLDILERVFNDSEASSTNPNLVGENDGHSDIPILVELVPGRKNALAALQFIAYLGCKEQNEKNAIRRQHGQVVSNSSVRSH